MPLIKLCCDTCAFRVREGERVICAYDGSGTSADWFCRHWEERENDREGDARSVRKGD